MNWMDRPLVPARGAVRNTSVLPEGELESPLMVTEGEAPVKVRVFAAEEEEMLVPSASNRSPPTVMGAVRVMLAAPRKAAMSPLRLFQAI